MQMSAKHIQMVNILMSKYHIKDIIAKMISFKGEPDTNANTVAETNPSKYIELIKSKYGKCGSFAIYSEINTCKKAKHGVGDMSWLLSFKKEDINPRFVFVGLNISNQINKPFSNFHSSSTTAHDYKIRYAVQKTPSFIGSYMTDIIKDYEEKISGKVMVYLNSNPDFVKKHIETFEEELTDIGLDKPVIIAFGNDCEKILKKHKLHNKYKVYKVPHYSSCISKEKLREKLLEIKIDLEK